MPTEAIESSVPIPPDQGRRQAPRKKLFKRRETSEKKAKDYKDPRKDTDSPGTVDRYA